MDAQFLLLETLQVLLTSGVGGILIVTYATRDLFIKDANPQPPESQFASDYSELMWLAEKQRHHVSREESRRFYQLRREWPEMHAFLTNGMSPV